MAEKANLNLMPKSQAAIEPVQAPVTGSGIATNKTSPKAPYLSTSLLRLLTWPNHQVMNLSANGKRLSHLWSDSKKGRIKIIGIILPATDRKYAFGQDIPK
jgi:hypothetical protein